LTAAAPRPNISGFPVLSFHPLLRAITLVAALAAPEAAPPAAPAPAAAASALADDVERHAALGQRHLEHGRYEDAIGEFRRAYELRADPRLLLGIAEAYRRFGNAERASFFYERYLAAVPDDAPDREDVERKIAELGQGRPPAPPPLLAAQSERAAARDGAVRLDVAAAPAAPAAARAVWRRWWFWAAVGAVAVAGAVTAVAATRRDGGPAIPTTDLGDKRFY
jgi:tetratricopeptide (TPR) repeat protein